MPAMRGRPHAAQAGHAAARDRPRGDPMIAALYVLPDGPYSNLPDVDPWPESRDARLYAGPWPVVAHPPCSRWCRLAGLVEARWGHKRGDDGGCFASALNSVRTWGGVLEHPAYSDAWAHHGLGKPSIGGWQRLLCGGWTAHVEQWHYGHAAKKATWLYAFGVPSLPTLIWERTADASQMAYVAGSLKTRSERRALISWCGNHTRSGDDRPRLGQRAASTTPIPFRDLLLSLARSVKQPVVSHSGSRPAIGRAVQATRPRSFQFAVESVDRRRFPQPLQGSRPAPSFPGRGACLVQSES